MEILLMGPLDGLHFHSPHPGPLPRGEGESPAVFRPYPRRSLLSQCAPNMGPAMAVPSPRGRGSRLGETKVATGCRCLKGLLSMDIFKATCINHTKANSS